MNSSIIFIPSVVQTAAGIGKVEFSYLSNSFNGSTTVEMTPSLDSFIASNVVTISFMHDLHPNSKVSNEYVCTLSTINFWGLQEQI